MFLQDNPEAEIKVEKDGTGEKKEDDFQTDDDKEEENMEVESDHLQKRKKVSRSLHRNSAMTVIHSGAKVAQEVERVNW